MINDPDAREDPDAITATLTHIAEHIKIWGEQSPEMLMALGMQPLPQPQVQPPIEGGAGAPADQVMAVGEEEMPNMPSIAGVPENSAPEDVEAFAEMGLQQP